MTCSLSPCSLSRSSMVGACDDDPDSPVMFPTFFCCLPAYLTRNESEVPPSFGSVLPPFVAAAVMHTEAEPETTGFVDSRGVGGAAVVAVVVGEVEVREVYLPGTVLFARTCSVNRNNRILEPIRSKIDIGKMFPRNT